MGRVLCIKRTFSIKEAGAEGILCMCNCLRTMYIINESLQYLFVKL